MIRVYSTPQVSPEQPRQGLRRVVNELHPYLAEHFTLVGSAKEADVIISHANQYQVAAGKLRPEQGFIAICHGLHPTGSYDAAVMGDALFAQNALILNNLIAADEILVPSRWVALPLERELLLDPTVVQWGIHWGEWQHNHNHEGYVLWNKNRQDVVCNPQPALDAARLLPRIPFKMTWGRAAANVEVLARRKGEAIPYEDMKRLIQKAGVYLATTKETGDIGSREALAAGVPVVAFAHGAVLDFLQHGVNGYLVTVGDIDGLAKGIEYCLQHREVLSHNARELAKGYTWDGAGQALVDAVRNTYERKQLEKSRPLVSVIIPCYNYGQYVGAAIESVLSQQTTFPFELIIVDDRSTDNSVQVIRDTLAKYDNPPATYYVNEENKGVAATRNWGISNAKSKYIICLDADDMLHAGALQALIPPLEADPLLGITFGRLTLYHDDGKESLGNWLSMPFDVEAQLTGQFNQIPTCCAFRRADWERVGGYRAAMQPAEDADLWTRILAFTGRTAKKVTDNATLRYRLHPASLRSQHNGDPYALRGCPTWAGQNRLLASPPTNGRASNPVRAYDNPLLKIEFIGGRSESQPFAALDALYEQTEWNWTLVDNAPFVVQWEHGREYKRDYLRQFITALIRENKVAEMCCGNYRIHQGETMDDGDFLLVEWLVDYRGSPLRSPTNQRNETGKVLMYVSDFLSGRTRAKVHKKDVKALVDGGKAKLVPPSTVLTATPLVTPPAAPSLLPVTVPVATVAVIDETNVNEEKEKQAAAIEPEWDDPLANTQIKTYVSPEKRKAKR